LAIEPNDLRVEFRIHGATSWTPTR
jgi:hypothetical protein